MRGLTPELTRKQSRSDWFSGWTNCYAGVAVMLGHSNEGQNTITKLGFCGFGENRKVRCSRSRRQPVHDSNDVGRRSESVDDGEKSRGVLPGAGAANAEVLPKEHAARLLPHYRITPELSRAAKRLRLE
jgi:hypothetical protein